MRMGSSGDAIDLLTVSDFDIKTSMHNEAETKETLMAVLCIEMTKLCTCIRCILSIRQFRGSLTSQSSILSITAENAGNTYDRILQDSDSLLANWYAGISGEGSGLNFGVETDNATDISVILHRVLLHTTYFAAVITLHSPTLNSHSAATPYKTIDKRSSVNSGRMLRYAAQQTSKQAELMDQYNLKEYLPSFR
jgi:hypothetical protein